MKSDCAFRMGKTHLVCEDYAVAGEEAGYAYVLLADGCSSSPDTDIGARLLVKSAQRELRCLFTGLEEGVQQECEEEQWKSYHARTLAHGLAVAAQLGLVRRCLDATLLTAISDGRHWYVDIVGDGVLVVKGRDQALKVTSVSYAANCPEYLNYISDPDRSAAFATLKANTREVERLCVGPRGIIESEVSSSETRSVLTGSVEETEWIAVLSDGVHSFTEIERSSTSRLTSLVALAEVLSGLTAFKASAGQFVQRRMQRFLEEVASLGRQHNDDLAMGAILFC